MVGKYKVITLPVWSTRFKNEFMEAQKRMILPEPL